MDLRSLRVMFESFTSSNTFKNWKRPIVPFLIFLFLFIVFEEPLMSVFNNVFIPVLSKVNEGYFPSIIFILLLLILSWFWRNRFKKKYFVSPTFISISSLICGIYWYYRIFSNEYIVFQSSLFYVGFADVIFGWLSLFDIIAFILDLQSCDKKSPESGISNFIDDNPIESFEDDILGFDKDIKKLVNDISNRKQSNSFSIGINASWGDGKSSFINLLKLSLDPDLFIIIEFNPRHSKSQQTIQTSFFDELLSTLSKYDSRFKSYFYEYLNIIDVAANNSYLKSAIQFTKVLNRQDEKEKINIAIERLYKKIIIIIEDLDRLTKDEVIEVFKLIDCNASFKNVIFISAYDKNRLESLIKEDTGAFSDKFFNFEKTLPLRPWQRLLDYFQSRLFEDLQISSDMKNELQQTIIANSDILKCYLTNIRDIKRFINLIKPSIPGICNDIIFRDYLLISLVRYKYPSEYRSIYINNLPSGPQFNLNKGITISDSKDLKSKGIIDVIFPEDENVRFRSINNPSSFEIYFHDDVFGHASIALLETLFGSGSDYKAIIADILNQKLWNELIDYLGTIRLLSVPTLEKIERILDIYLWLNMKYSENLYSIINIGQFFNKEIALTLCKRYNLTIENYKAKLGDKLKGFYPYYPIGVVKQFLWAEVRQENNEPIVFDKEELLRAAKFIFNDFVHNDSVVSERHFDLLYSCIKDIDPVSDKVTLDHDACVSMQKLIIQTPQFYIQNFVRLGGISSSPDFNSISCEPFWQQIFDSAEIFEDFILDTKLDDIVGINRVRNFWELYKSNNFKPIEFNNMGDVKAKIDSGLNDEVESLQKLKNIHRELSELELILSTKDSESYDLREIHQKVVKLNKNLESILLPVHLRSVVLNLINTINAKIDNIINSSQLKLPPDVGDV